MYKCLVIFVLLVTSCFNIYAEPAPFGLELNKSTYQEVKKKFSGSDKGINKFSLGKMYLINLNEFDLEGIQNVEAIFDKDDRLTALLMDFQKNRYESLKKSLIQKYTLVDEKKEFVGDQYTKLTSDSTQIILEAPHMSRVVKLDYLSNDFVDQWNTIMLREKQQKLQKQEDSL